MQLIAKPDPSFAAEANEVVCLATPEPFGAIGTW